MPPLKLGLDTNVYIQSLMRPGSFLDSELRRLADARLVTLYTSEEILLELRHKAEQKFGFDAKESSQLAQLCRKLCTVVEPTRRVQVVARDPDDDKILECALEASADVIVTADKDLLQLTEFEAIRMLHPTQLKFLFPPAAD